MSEKYLAQSDYTFLHRVFIWKRILFGALLLLLIMFIAFDIYYGLEDSEKSIISIISNSLKTTIFFLITIISYFYSPKEDKPSTWKTLVEIDFAAKEMMINRQKIIFQDISCIKIKEVDLSFFPTYYKLWAKMKNGEKEKVIALTDAKEYSFLLKKFIESGILVE